MAVCFVHQGFQGREWNFWVAWNIVIILCPWVACNTLKTPQREESQNQPTIALFSSLYPVWHRARHMELSLFVETVESEGSFMSM